MIVNILILIPEVVLNALVLITYAKQSANMLLMALSLSDFCVCVVIAQPLWVAKKILQFFVTFNCYIWVVDRLLLQGTCGVSLLIIVVLSLERFVTLAYPFRSQLGITRFRLKVVISVSTLLWMFVSCEVFQPSGYVVPVIVDTFIIFSVIVNL